MADGYALIGEPELALRWLEYTIDYGIRNPAFLGKHEPFLEPLRSTQRFGELMEKATRLSEPLPVPAESIQLMGGGR
jgi:hypothetical protein